MSAADRPFPGEPAFSDPSSHRAGGPPGARFRTICSG